MANQEDCRRMIAEHYTFCLSEKLSDVSLAVLDVSPCPLNRDKGNIWYVNRINVPLHFRGWGVGTGLVARLTYLANEFGLTLYVHPTENYGADLPRLRSFFARFGFFPDATFGGSGAMTRAPAHQRETPNAGNQS